MIVFELGAVVDWSQNVLCRIKSVKLGKERLTGIQYYVAGTTEAQFESCDMDSCLSRRLHFHFGR